MEFKEGKYKGFVAFHPVLIESDWNLKCNAIEERLFISGSINRIRLEFKEKSNCEWRSKNCCINRIRLEFKGNCSNIPWNGQRVLIESDWNLKCNLPASEWTSGNRINRIRLEFKVYNGICCFVFVLRINRIRLEFKVLPISWQPLKTYWY